MAQPQSPTPPPSSGIPAGVARLEGPLRQILEEGIAHQRARRFREAEESYRRAVAQHPDQPDALNLLATLIVAAGGAPEAARLLRRALELRPGETSFRANLVAVLVVLDRIDEALAEIGIARAEAPEALDVEMNYAGVLRRLGRVAESLAVYERIAQARPDSHMPRQGVARCLVELGRFDEAAAVLRDILIQRPDEPGAHIELAAIGAAAADSGQLARTVALATTGQLPAATRIGLFHAAARICEDLGRYDEAIEHVQAAKKMIRPSGAPNALATSVSRMIAAFDAELFAAKRGHGDASVRPVFVVGMPRAGTSHVARLLGSHPQVAVAGELPRVPLLTLAMSEVIVLTQPYPQAMRELTPEAIRRLAARYLQQLDNTSVDADRIVDPLPTNFEHLGLLALLFPNAAVVHCRRDPLDVGLSCYLQNFPEGGSPLHEFAQIAQFMREHDRLMAHWRTVLPQPVHEVAYEDLAADPDRVLPRLLDAIGLPWDERCAAATADGSPFRVALARDAADRCRHYEKHLGPLREALGK
jgi:tetratricopeptide (TPR) repeat protein